MNIDELIKSDLSEYYQGNEPELYTPIFVDDVSNWRCYVFGECFSLVAYHYGEWVYLKAISDDDGNYWVSNKGLHLGAGWIDSIKKVSTIMKDWLDTNCKPGYYSGHEGEKGWECSYTDLKKDERI